MNNCEYALALSRQLRTAPLQMVSAFKPTNKDGELSPIIATGACTRILFNITMLQGWTGMRQTYAS